MGFSVWEGQTSKHPMCCLVCMCPDVRTYTSELGSQGKGHLTQPEDLGGNVMLTEFRKQNRCFQLGKDDEGGMGEAAGRTG